MVIIILQEAFCRNVSDKMWDKRMPKFKYLETLNIKYFKNKIQKKSKPWQQIENAKIQPPQKNQTISPSKNVEYLIKKKVIFIQNNIIEQHVLQKHANLLKKSKILPKPNLYHKKINQFPLKQNRMSHLSKNVHLFSVCVIN